jgi:hypothetical protein
LRQERTGIAEDLFRLPVNVSAAQGFRKLSRPGNIVLPILPLIQLIPELFLGHHIFPIKKSRHHLCRLCSFLPEE